MRIAFVGREKGLVIKPFFARKKATNSHDNDLDRT